LTCWTQLRNFIKRLLHLEIPFVVSNEETLVRGIVHPLFYSPNKKVLKREAFLPPPDKREVSLLRRLYTNDNFCKNHSASLSIANNEYCGLATFRACHINQINEETDPEARTEIKATPLNKDNKPISRPPVFVNDPGLPMHADLLYQVPFVKGEVYTSYRAYASKLVKLANYFNDPSPGTQNWKGEKLSWKERVII
jgi:hypothetical protein